MAFSFLWIEMVCEISFGLVSELTLWSLSGKVAGCIPRHPRSKTRQSRVLS